MSPSQFFRQLSASTLILPTQSKPSGLQTFTWGETNHVKSRNYKNFKPFLERKILNWEESSHRYRSSCGHISWSNNGCILPHPGILSSPLLEIRNPQWPLFVWCQSGHNFPPRRERSVSGLEKTWNKYWSKRDFSQTALRRFAISSSLKWCVNYSGPKGSYKQTGFFKKGSAFSSISSDWSVQLI